MPGVTMKGIGTLPRGLALVTGKSSLYLYYCWCLIQQKVHDIF